MRTLRYVVADVFTDRPLAGNQLAVFTDARELDSQTMQALALEMSFSETVFVLPAEGDGDVRIRIFTPRTELPFAGHPVLGTAFVLAGPLQKGLIALETGRGVVPIELERDDSGRIVFGRMTQPVPTVEPYPQVEALLVALGVETSIVPVERYDNGLLFTYVGLRTRDEVASLQPDLTALTDLDVMANCFAGSGSDWKVRMFAPSVGVREDPATGSAAGPLACHLCRHGLVDWGAEIEVEQGVELGPAFQALRRCTRRQRFDRRSRGRWARGRRRARRVSPRSPWSDQVSHPVDKLEAYGEQYRDVRRRMEEAILPLATSVDGRHFTCQASPHRISMRTGGYVVIEESGTTRLGQILELELVEVDGPELGSGGGDSEGAQIAATVRLRGVRGTGVIRDGDGTPFHDGLMRPAKPSEVHTWLDRVRPPRARLEVGELQLAPGAAFCLDSGGFDRHTFLCGQSGSGKTYSLGVMLEQLLLETSLRMVVLDPNSDFVALGHTRAGVASDVVDRHRERAGVVVRQAADGGGERLRLRFADLDPRVQAAALRLDPVADRGEYSELVEILGMWAESGKASSLDELLTFGGTEARALGERLRNLGVDRWGVWARDDEGSVVEELAARTARCLVVDLGSLQTLEEKALVSEAVLATLWRHRTGREPTLVVVDEAHNVCPSEPSDPITAIATEHAVRIAAEGRKFGLYLLVSTQRPHKVHEQVLSQCDNLVLMRMNSRSDLAYVGELFSFVPPALLAAATDFGLGEALVAGKIASHPALVRFGDRITEEGGSDVPADWAAPRS